MKTKRRWMTSILAESTKKTAALPWARGTRPTRARPAKAMHAARA
ncbi:hypothetical protein [Actibacterium sp. D379-3]